MNHNINQIASYDMVAAEYYDVIRHPTCANFSDLSSRFLTPRIQKYANRTLKILEVGAGRSTAAPVISSAGLPLSNLTLLDKSPSMLSHSQDWIQRGAHQVVGDACHPELSAASFGLIIASLGDPYNCLSFWRSVERLLLMGGVCLFTTPAYEWAKRYREGTVLTLAEFVLADGGIIHVPSIIRRHPEQIRVIKQSGLQIIETEGLTAAQLSGPHSPKLCMSAETAELPVVCGLVMQKSKRL